MTVARGIGKSGKVAMYEVPDTDLAVGSTLGGPKATTIIKANGAIEKVFSVEHGKVLFGTVILRYYDGTSGAHLSQDRPGRFVLHPEHQEHMYSLSNHVAVLEDIFVLSGQPDGDGHVDPPGVYQTVQLRNDGDEPIDVVTYAYADLRGETSHDVKATYNKQLGAIIAWNESIPEQCRIFGCSRKAESYETTLDSGKAVSERCPGRLSGKTLAASDPLGVMQHSIRIEPGKTVEWSYLLSFGDGREGATKNYRACPRAADALARTKEYYDDVLHRAVVLTPDSSVNEGVIWAKANMLRVQNQAQTGWCFTNDPTRSNNSVGRDTAWFAFGADYLMPDFARDSLLAYVKRQEKSGLIVEYYDIRTGATEDYGLNINDNTPLLILALWHHYNLTEDIDFLNQVYPAAAKAARYILSQRNDQGLVWCTATGVSDWGIVGWRNVIPNYRLSGATTEVNSECYAALRTISQMARTLEKHDESSMFSHEADAIRDAINMHLLNPDTGLYYLNIDLHGNVHTDVTSDLVFPIIFGVASERTAANIIRRLSTRDFWTEAGMRTTPRDAIDYTPDGGWGLLGGVWVGVSFWYAFAAAKFSPQLMAHALSTSFQNYASDPRRNNTVPGQFSEWLHGETLVNQGMMLSPWFPPRYLWAAIEGVAGFDASGNAVSVSPLLPPDWKWLAVQNLPFRGRRLTWFAVRMADGLRVHTNFAALGDITASVTHETDVTSTVSATTDTAYIVALQRGANLLIFVGNASQHTSTTSVRVLNGLAGAYRLRTYNSMTEEWIENEGLISADELRQGHTVELEGKGYSMLELRQEV